MKPVLYAIAVPRPLNGATWNNFMTWGAYSTYQNDGLDGMDYTDFLFRHGQTATFSSREAWFIPFIGNALIDILDTLPVY